jgi:hypothetical protein
MIFRKIVLIAISILMLGGISHAAPFTQIFTNDFQTDSIYLIITEGDVEFQKWQLVPTNWEIGDNQPDMISASGPMIDPGERFRVKFSDRGAFTLEWAEVLDGVVMGSGSLFSENGSFVSASDIFTSQSQIPTPTTGSIWLLGSGVVCLFCARRKLIAPKQRDRN